MSWITVSDVESYMGTTLDSANSVIMTSVIGATCGYIENYCDTKFDDAVYSQQIDIQDNAFNLKNNFQRFYNVSISTENNITVAVTSKDFKSIEINELGTTLSLIDNYTNTDIDISSLTLESLVTAINLNNLNSGWTATLSYSSDNNYARILYPGTYRADSSGNIYLLSASSQISARKKSKNCFGTNVECGEGIAIYQGGFATIPEDLKDVTIRMTLAAYNNKNSAAIVGPKKSLKLGDYSETNFGSGDSSVYFSSISIDYMDILAKYKNFTI